MPVAFVQEFAIRDDDRSTTNYDAVSERLNPDANWPEGLIFHTAGWDEDRKVFRIFDVWETREQGQRFVDERVMPIVMELGGGDRPLVPPEREYYYEIHHLVKQ